MGGRRFLPLLFLMILLALATSPLLAQDALTQTEQAVDTDGTIVTVSFPDGWAASTDKQGILLGSSADALTELKQTGLVSTAGEIGMIVSLPNFLDNLSLPHDAPADQAVSKYLESAKLPDATVETSTDFSVPAATAVVTPPNQTTLQAMIGALQFPDGTVIIGVIPASALDATVMAILQSVTLQAPADIPAVTPDPDVSLTPASFDYIDAKGAVTLSLGLPEGWVSQYSDHAAILYLGNSDAALKKASAPDVTFESGEIGITIALPHAVVGLGVHPDAAPDAAISEFQSRTNAQGRVVADDSFGVPAAHARLTGGNLPDGGGDVYALKFDQGLVFVVVQPTGFIDGTLMAIIQSTQLGQTPLPQSTAAATEQSSTGKTTTIPVTQPNGAFELSFSLPDGWVEQVGSSGTSINIGSSTAVADKVAKGREALAAGEVGLTIGVPQLLSQTGVTFDATPEDAVSNFIKITNSKGTVEQDADFSVPAAHATITGDAIPGGGAELYALAFDGGTLLIAVQPQGATSGDVLDLLKSIQFAPSSGDSAPATAIPEATALPAATATPAASAKPLRQWASSADASSQYGNDDWSAAQATGKPNTTDCADTGTAWASESSTERAILRVQFDKPVIASQINIYQSFNPGAIVEVDLGSAADSNKVLPLPNSADPAGNTACPGVFSIDVSGVDVPVNFIVIYIDQSLTGNWNEIDAVELVGTPAS